VGGWNLQIVGFDNPPTLLERRFWSPSGLARQSGAGRFDLREAFRGSCPEAGGHAFRRVCQGPSAWRQWREDHPEVEPDLSGAQLADVDLEDADLIDVNLSGANLRRAKLARCNLAGARLTGADVTGAPQGYAFSAALSFRRFAGAELSVKPANWSSDDNSRLTVKGIQLSGMDLRFADMKASFLRNAFLTDTDLQNADLLGADLEQAGMIGTDLRGASLANADLRKATLVRAKLEGADIKYEPDIRTACPCRPLPFAGRARERRTPALRQMTSGAIA
jgi:hypothetical protein